MENTEVFLKKVLLSSKKLSFSLHISLYIPIIHLK